MHEFVSPMEVAELAEFVPTGAETGGFRGERNDGCNGRADPLLREFF